MPLGAQVWSRARILFVSELGGGFGHVRRLLPLARELANAGYSPTFVVRAPREVASAPGMAGFELRPLPYAMPAPRAFEGRVARDCADILGISGFEDEQFLSRATAAWERELKELQPLATVCEFSPLFGLAARASDVPVLVLGHGFVLPPPDLPTFPALHQGAALFDAQRLLEIASNVAGARGGCPLEALPQLFAGRAHYVTGLDVLDPYRSQRAQPALGPPGLWPAAAPQAPTEDVFGYLLGDAPSTRLILEALAKTQLSGRVYVRRPTATHHALLAGSRVTLLSDPANTREALARARIVVHHASMLMTEEALIAARPQLVAPLYLEHLITARELAKLDVAEIVRPSDGVATIVELVRALARDAARAQSAQRVANTLDAEARTGAEAPPLLRHTLETWLE